MALTVGPYVIAPLAGVLCLSATAALCLFRPLTSGALSGLARAAGLALAVWGVLLLIGLSLDASSPWRPLTPLTRTTGLTVTATTSPAAIVTDNVALTQALARATERNRPALVYFTADWCVSCRVIEHEMFENDAVRAAFNGVDLIKVDVTRSTPDARALMERYGVIGPPTLAFFASDVGEMPKTRLIGEVSARKLLASLERVGDKA
ncbi:thioredoxin family protein [Brevundimonas nasdae]|uniref:thioredoxin family protein n=1 Tax=Brevundimonas nasdae TaxID=172043 RepID=UPI001FD19C2B|nr:thioredoxin family protein [Brevundimonas nasdae]